MREDDKGSSASSVPSITVDAEAGWLQDRTLRQSHGDRGGEYTLAKEWLAADGALDHAGADEFRRLIRAVDPVRGTVEGMRGRHSNDLLSSWSEMGPPPRDRAENQRYTKADSPGLYLSEGGLNVAERAVCLELRCSRKARAAPDTRPLYVHAYSVNADPLRLADLAAVESTSFLSWVFTFAEDIEGMDDFTWNVGALVAKHWQGMRVPGVRGGKGFHYRNVVLFDPYTNDAWHDWICKDRAAKASTIECTCAYT